MKMHALPEQEPARTQSALEDEFQALRSQVRRLRACAVTATAAVVGAALLGAAPRSGVIEAQRINIRGADGKLYLAIAAPDQIPGNIFSGKEWPRDLSKGRAESAGLLFYSSRGDEVGGLLYSVRETKEGPVAVGHLSFDKYRQDQTVALQHLQSGQTERAGLNVWDQPSDLPLENVVSLLDQIKRGSPEQASAARKTLQAHAAKQELGSHRVFVGAENRTALLALKDAAGQDRARLSVGPDGAGRLEFLSAEGTVVDRYPK